MSCGMDLRLHDCRVVLYSQYTHDMNKIDELRDIGNKILEFETIIDLGKV